MKHDFADTFRHDGVAAAYRFRPPYPEALLDRLVALAGEMGRVLDLGAGDGALARPLASRGAIVDAVEPSEAMVAAGRQLPDGDDKRLSWHVAAAEDFTCPGPFALVTIGAALHWLDLPTVSKRLLDVTTSSTTVAVVDRTATLPGLREALLPIIRRFSRNQAFDPTYSAAEEMEERGFWRIHGKQTTPPVPFRQSVDDHLESLHSTATLARELLTPAEITGFDAAARAVLLDFASTGTLDLALTATITWGTLTRS